MAEKHTTLTQLEMLALKGRADSLLRDKELLDLVIQGFKEVRHNGITVTLPAANWSGRAQTVKHESLLADGNYWYLVCGDAGVKADDISINGEVTFRCENIPIEDLIVNIIRLEVDTDG